MTTATRTRAYVEVTSDGDINLVRGDDDVKLASVTFSFQLANCMFGDDESTWEDDAALAADILDSLLRGQRCYDLVDVVKRATLPGPVFDAPDYDVWLVDA